MSVDRLSVSPASSSLAISTAPLNAATAARAPSSADVDYELCRDLLAEHCRAAKVAALAPIKDRFPCFPNLLDTAAPDAALPVTTVS